MINLLSVLPDFDVQPYCHILPSLERALVSTADLLTLDALDVAKRAQVPPGEVRKLTTAVLDSLHASAIILHSDKAAANGESETDKQSLEHVVLTGPTAISTLDDALDAALGGGMARGKVTEFVGERYESWSYIADLANLVKCRR